MPKNDAMVKFHYGEVLIIYWIIVVGICGTGVTGRAVQDVSWRGPPYNVALLEGQMTSVCCNSSTSPHWRSFSPTEEGLANGESHAKPGYTVIESPSGKYCLQFTATSSTPTGISCSEAGSGIERSFHVIVLKSDPVCTDSSNDDYINATCTIGFSGNWPPEMHWTLNGENVPQNWVTCETKSNESVTSSLLLSRNSTTYSISCKSNFTEHLRPNKTTAKNVPTYTYIWPSSSMPPESPGVNGITALYIVLGCILSVLDIVIAIFIIIKKDASPQSAQHNSLSVT